MSTHALFVAAAYGVSALGVLGLVAWIFVDGQARRRELRALETSGVRRRSDARSGRPATALDADLS